METVIAKIDLKVHTEGPDQTFVSIKPAMTFQAYLLGFFGIWANSVKGQKMVFLFRRAVFQVMMALTTANSLLTIVRVISTLTLPGGAGSPSLIARALGILPAVTTSIKGPVILYTVAAKSTKLHDLCLNFNQIIHRLHLQEKKTMKSFVGKLTRLNVALVMISWCPQISYFTGQMITSSARMRTLADPFVILPSFPNFQVPFWAFLIFNLFCAVFPTLLAMLVQITLMIFAVSTWKIAAFINRELEDYDEIVKAVMESSDKKLAEDSFAHLVLKIKKTIRKRAGLYEFVQSINQQFGFVPFCFYCLDVAATGGLIGVVVLGGYTTTWDLGVRLFGAGNFLFQATVMYLPMVAATEKVLVQ
jgi:hypothetical protein